MKVSIIIPTYNGAQKIKNLLYSILEQTCSPAEVIVVVDGSTDNTIEVLGEFAYKMPNLKVLFQNNKGRGLVRNIGAKYAVGDILVFVDDDIRLFPDALEKHIAFHVKNSGCLLFGRVQLDPSNIGSNDFNRFRIKMESYGSFYTSKEKLIRITLQYYSFTSANLSCSIQVFRKIGGFDGKLTDSEDFDFSLRAFEMAVPIFYNPALRGWHDDYITLEKYIQRQVEYIQSKHRLSVLKPKYKKMHPPSFVYGFENNVFKRVFRKIFILNRFWLRLIDDKLFLKLVPVSLRDRIYDVIVSSSIIKNVRVK